MPTTVQQELRDAQLELWGLTSRLLTAAEEVKRKREGLIRLMKQTSERNTEQGDPTSSPQ